ncbi:ribose-phosphate pyrophosphokinase [Candidatus Gottesmanbacteria bacterium]|nr:ribose-phosphate pyrophosphokinase [Candidatus Gottesmanbacteria bacterium]
MRLFSGTSNKGLAERVAVSLGIPLGDVEITRFIDNECRVFVKEDVAGEDVFVLQSLSEVADQHLVELCLLGSSLRDLHAKKVTAVIPWMGYSKQDKAFRKGEAVSAQLIAKFIEAAGFDAVITMELHSENVLPFFHIPVTELSTHTVLHHALSELVPGAVSEGTVVVSPDRGGKSRSERFARAVGLPVVYLEKSRDTVTGEVRVTGIDGSVSGKPVIMFDDIINTGSTAVKTSEYVQKEGATAIYFLATHAVLAGSGAAVLAGSTISRVLVTDTVFIPENKKFATLAITSVSGIIADAIHNQTK